MPLHVSRSKDTHAPQRPANVAPSHSSSSLSSSFSSTASSVLLPAAPHSNSSQSDIVSSDHSASALQPSIKNRLFPLHITGPPRSSSLTTMGQAPSRSPAPSTPTSSQSAPVPVSAGGRFKRVWGARRKKSEDATATFAQVQDSGVKGKERATVESYYATPPESISEHSHLRPEFPNSRVSTAPRNISVQIASSALNVFGSKKLGQSPKSPKFSGSPPPPPLPPKPVSTPTVQNVVLPSLSAEVLLEAPSHAAVASHEMQSTDIPTRQKSEESEDGLLVTREKPIEDKEKLKEDWRKSDATMTSHVTVRPGALAGNRSPRPVSLAESSHSGHTIVPVNKRLSALITDAEFTMFEEGDSVGSEQEIIAHVSVSGRPSPTGSMKARNRRSVSLNLPPGFAARFKTSSSDLSAKPPLSAGPHSPNRLISDHAPSSPLASVHNTPTLTRAAASGYIAPLNTGDPAQRTSNHIRTHLAAWTAPTTPVQDERPLPPPPLPAVNQRRPGPHPNASLAPPSFRQTAVSMTGSLAPAAGFAMGFGKRAVEKVGRAWGGFSSSSSTHSGYSSSSSVETKSSSRAKISESGLGRGHSEVPQSMNGGWKKRKTHNTFSGSSSISSMASSSASDCDNFVPSGPSLGKRLRGPKRTPSGTSVVGGLVFRRDLQTCVQETATDHVLFQLVSRTEELDSESVIRPLEDRMLPALAVRCAQHLLKWGIQEEGLFRISGRSSHVAKLRSEFDSGGDFDMVECDPGDLDPHAVASIFKTYLRELPESILTTALIPYFESALAAEDEASSHGHESISSATRSGAKGPSLPAGPREGSPLSLRKPPSLSTLAMPSFAGMRTMSDSLLNALTWLISRLPQENRDLLYTVVELIKTTAARSQQTKMPLGNLLLVFCPSLNMSPSLLRVFCEADVIWKGIPETSIVPAPDAGFKRSQSDAVPLLGNREREGAEEAEGESEHTAADSLLASETLQTSSIAKSNSESSNSRQSSTPLTPGSLLDDTASYVSASEMRSAAPTRSPSPATSSAHVPPLSSSSESLDSPSTTSEEPISPQAVPYKSSPTTKDVYSSQTSLQIPDAIDVTLSPPCPRQLDVPSPVPFPSSGDSSPHSPDHSRRSIALFSFSKPKSESVSSSEPKRMKRPSLHLLFNKKSSSPLPCTASTGPYSAAAASAPAFSTYLSDDLTSPHLQPSSLSLPPVLDTPISSSPIHMGFDNSSKESTAENVPHSLAAVSKTMHSNLDVTYSPLAVHIRTNSYASSIFNTPQQTPIADFYRNRSKSLLSFSSEADVPDTPSHVARVRSPSQASQTSLSPSIALEIEDDTSEDWAQSVLTATQTDRH